MVHASVSVIARILCLLLVVRLVAGAMLGTEPEYKAAATHSLTGQFQGTASDSAEPSRLCTAGHACALLAGASPMPPPSSKVVVLAHG